MFYIQINLKLNFYLKNSVLSSAKEPKTFFTTHHFVCLTSRFFIVSAYFFLFNFLQGNCHFFIICQIFINFDWFLFKFVYLDSFFVDSRLFCNSRFILFFFLPFFKFQLKFGFKIDARTVLRYKYKEILYGIHTESVVVF